MYAFIQESEERRSTSRSAQCAGSSRQQKWQQDSDSRQHDRHGSRSTCHVRRPGVDAGGDPPGQQNLLLPCTPARPCCAFNRHLRRSQKANIIIIIAIALARGRRRHAVVRVRCPPDACLPVRIQKAKGIHSAIKGICCRIRNLLALLGPS